MHQKTADSNTLSNYRTYNKQILKNYPMKKINFIVFFLLTFLFITFACNSNSNPGGYLISGKIKNAEGLTIFLEQLENNQTVIIDSAKISKDGSFKMKGIVSEKTICNFRVADKQALMLVVDNISCKIDADLNDFTNYIIEGSPESVTLKNFIKKTQSEYARLSELQKQFQLAAQTETMTPNLPPAQKQTLKIEEEYKSILNNQHQYFYGFADTVKSALLAIFVTNFANPETDAALFQQVASKVKQEIPDSKTGKEFMNKVNEMTRISIGAIAPEIILPDPEGNTVSLSSLKGKIVFLDFWASWCRPCRMESPNNVNIYKQYKDKGLVIFSISLDKDKQKWIEAIKQDKLIWKEHGLEDIANPQTSQLYRVNSIPKTYLIDKEGKIIAINLRGKQLEDKISEIFAQ